MSVVDDPIVVHLQASPRCCFQHIEPIGDRVVCLCGWSAGAEAGVSVMCPKPTAQDHPVASPEPYVRCGDKNEPAKDVADLQHAIDFVITKASVPRARPGDYSAYVDDDHPELGVGIYRADGTPVIVMPLEVYRALEKKP